MAKRRWFHMSTKTFEAARPACEELQARLSPGKGLRMIWNEDMTSCLICLDGASKEWRAPQRWIEDCVEVYCRTSYPGLSRIAVSSAWRLPSEDPEKRDDGEENFWEDDRYIKGH